MVRGLMGWYGAEGRDESDQRLRNTAFGQTGRGYRGVSSGCYGLDEQVGFKAFAWDMSR